jgi:hypothetical protein
MRTLATEKILLSISPLPEENRPESFSGAIGEFFPLEPKISLPKNFTIGTPVDLIFSVQGTGNLRNLTTPLLPLDSQWKLYRSHRRIEPMDPLGFETTISFHYTLIPQVARPNLPPFHFTFFNPHSASYQTLEETFPPSILPASGVQLPPPQTFSAERLTSHLSLKKNLGFSSWADEMSSPFENYSFWLLHGCLAGACLLFFLALKRNRRESPFREQMKKFTLPRVRKSLLEAHNAQEHNQVNPFYQAIRQAVLYTLNGLAHSQTPPIGAMDTLQRLQKSQVLQHRILARRILHFTEAPEIREPVTLSPEVLEADWLSAIHLIESLQRLFQ